ncbi:ABC transporter ATP-binding protein [Thiomicrorhabdus sp. ZW0627]|uniref:ABC transporter ATP-binding protein n=1 Tax=Thiomicrorhabdus sp. ZW0627 TaxID=3039774 RepID=UPI0024370CB6|nr:ABC transporter ATP-binding protein [Thiomicrorhabdus sp. ZW0627]MDG6773830.1 ABC transporter ATP-binding protein [Thiomicrorhabdus sp. ZW0627]
MNPELAIECHQLTRKFADVTAVNGLDLHIPKQTIYGFLGPNGSGKSTAIRMLCGLLLPTSGEVNVLGHQVPQQAEQLKKHIGYMTQAFSLYSDLTVKENLRFMAQVYGLSGKTQNRRIDEALSVYHLQGLQNRFPSNMSGGERQRLALATATLHDPKLLFLDEPTSAVDPQSRRDFWESLFDLVAEGVTILVSTHYMDEAERCHDLAILDHGVKVADGSPSDLMASMEAWVVQVEDSDVLKLKPHLASLPDVISVSHIGLHLRILVNKSIAQPVAYIQQQTGFLDTDVQVREVAPSMEDVFVVATQKRKQEHDR